MDKAEKIINDLINSLVPDDCTIDATEACRALIERIRLDAVSGSDMLNAKRCAEAFLLIYQAYELEQ